MTIFLNLRTAQIIVLSLLLAVCSVTTNPQGDPARGEQLFNTKLEGGNENHACSDCHSLDGAQESAPTFMGISQHSLEMTEGMEIQEYLRQSIVEPGAHRAGYFPNEMPTVYGEVLNEQQVNDLIEFLLTQ